MSLLLHVIVTYIKENIITKLQKYTACPALFVKNLLCMGDLSPACKIFVERPEAPPPPPPHQILKSCPPLPPLSSPPLSSPPSPPPSPPPLSSPPLSSPPMFSTSVQNPALGFNSSIFVHSCFPPKFQFLYCLLSSLSLQGAPMVGTERKIFKI